MAYSASPKLSVIYEDLVIIDRLGLFFPNIWFDFEEAAKSSLAEHRGEF